MLLSEFIEMVPVQKLVLFQGVVVLKKNLANPALKVLIRWCVGAQQPCRQLSWHAFHASLPTQSLRSIFSFRRFLHLFSPHRLSHLSQSYFSLFSSTPYHCACLESQHRSDACVGSHSSKSYLSKARSLCATGFDWGGCVRHSPG